IGRPEKVEGAVDGSQAAAAVVLVEPGQPAEHAVAPLGVEARGRVQQPLQRVSTLGAGCDQRLEQAAGGHKANAAVIVDHGESHDVVEDHAAAPALSRRWIQASGFIISASVGSLSGPSHTWFMKAMPRCWVTWLTNATPRRYWSSFICRPVMRRN